MDEKKENCTSLEEFYLDRMTKILDALPDRGKNLDVEQSIGDYIKREVSTSMA